jgi:hypothetical protein
MDRRQTRLWRALWERHAWLAVYFTFDSAERKLSRRYLPPAAANRASQQYRHYRRQFAVKTRVPVCRYDAFVKDAHGTNRPAYRKETTSRQCPPSSALARYR